MTSRQKRSQLSVLKRAATPLALVLTTALTCAIAPSAQAIHLAGDQEAMEFGSRVMTVAGSGEVQGGHQFVEVRRLVLPQRTDQNTTVQLAGIKRKEIDTTGKSNLPGDDVLPFYRAPETLPAGQGTVIRTEPMNVHTTPVKWAKLGKAKRVLYTTENTFGKKIAVSGMIIEPTEPWQGKGPQPVIGYAPGTRGWADKCAPSRQAALGLDYETPMYRGLLERGYVVAITDYEGLGTAGHHTYVMHKSAGNAVTDVVRAALNLKIGKTSPKSPIAFTGYSQGGGATGSAVERASTYAPELNLKGAVVGAPPSDLRAVAKHGDKGTLAGMLFGAVASVAHTYGQGQLLADTFNADGMAKMRKTMNTCAVESIFDSAGSDTRKFTQDGKSLYDNLGREPWYTMSRQTMLGTQKPNVPVLLLSSQNDPVIPIGQVSNLNKAWCDRGAHVTFRKKGNLLHLGGLYFNASEMNHYVEHRVEGKKLPKSTCGK